MLRVLSEPWEGDNVVKANDLNDDFTAEWNDRNGKIEDFRITRGASLYSLPWYRRILMRLIGRSHWHRVKFK